jgi:hypothetical protein
MHVLASPSQHGKRHAEIAVLFRRAFIDDAALALLGALLQAAAARARIE